MTADISPDVQRRHPIFEGTEFCGRVLSHGTRVCILPLGHEATEDCALPVEPKTVTIGGTEWRIVESKTTGPYFQYRHNKAGSWVGSVSVAHVRELHGALASLLPPSTDTQEETTRKCSVCACPFWCSECLREEMADLKKEVFGDSTP